MPRQSNLFQMQEQDKATDRDKSITNISNITDGEFKATIIRILTGLEKRTEDISDIWYQNQKWRMKNAINETGNRFDAMKSRLEETEEWINKKTKENNEAEKNKKKNYVTWK